ncbi:uncharacterized protein G2W53_041855 [Senna tora]|uniref:Uncharacterized protein n=1 Tax=Senna tora TaxID=362788 RepID=A0A834W394_9FABA|nr:uncharacterized protein G2W53_041855 [Senna tora]
MDLLIPPSSSCSHKHSSKNSKRDWDALTPIKIFPLVLEGADGDGFVAQVISEGEAGDGVEDVESVGVIGAT